ncbi:hypothetical protein HU200_066264 [Digitaria exilis]|uniref:VWFA domain-containing protein n=1 Tax=Digitaria exilis TaxID=1010633 RepID=A0A835A7Z9_9POAL|nr:hypothetical protein HU200_066264 [Digitaria exilis]
MTRSINISRRNLGTNQGMNLVRPAPILFCSATTREGENGKRTGGYMDADLPYDGMGWGAERRSSGRGTGGPRFRQEIFVRRIAGPSPRVKIAGRRTTGQEGQGFREQGDRQVPLIAGRPITVRTTGRKADGSFQNLGGGRTMMLFGFTTRVQDVMSLRSTKGLVCINQVKYFKDEVALTADTLTAEAEIKATSSSVVREGLDLVAVLDVSGRVYGKKMEYMKEAMMLVIRKLTPVDRLSIVTFSDVATRLCPLRCMTDAAQDDLVALVTGLQANGGPNIMAGLETGLRVIADRVNTKARIATVFLLSDGHQTSGDARQVDPGQVVIHTFGLGRGTDHRLMIDIAEKSPFGTGTYCSVHTWSISQLLDSLLTVVAQDVELTITPCMEDDDVDTIVVAPGTNFRQATDATTGMITIKFGTLSAGEVRRVVVNLTLKHSSVTEEYDARLAEAQHVFTAQGKRLKQVPQDILVLRTTTASPKLRRWQLHDAEIGRRRPDDIRQVRVLHDGQLLLNRLQAELLKLTEGVVHIGSDTFLEQAKNFSKVPRRQRAPPMMTM